MKVRNVVIAGTVMLVGIGGCSAAVLSGMDSNTSPGHSTVKETSTKPETPAERTGPFSSFRDGTFKVGTDIKVGTYKTDGESHDELSDYCYWERARDDSGEMDSIITNDFSSGPNRVTVRPGEIFKTSGGCDWKLVG